ncbi:MAG: FISUMP domain-containing protein [Bacteroidales bacterium]
MKKILLAATLVMLVSALSGQETFRDKRDGNVYTTVNIQGITWMAENLRYKSAAGSSWFEKDSVNSKKYGILYDWTSATKACPDGWRLPTGDEFRLLVNYNDQKGAWKTKKAGSDSFGIQLGGMQDYEGNFSEMEESAYFWTSTEYDKDHAEYLSYLILTDNTVVDVSHKEDIEDVHGTEKINKYSVRCVRKIK